MKRCPNCGAQIERQGDAMCAYCGAQLQENVPQQKITYEPPPKQTPLMQKVNKSAEIANKVYLSKILSIVSLVFSSFFVLAVIAIIMASVSMVIGIVFYVFASVLTALM